MSDATDQPEHDNDEETFGDDEPDDSVDATDE